MKSTLSKYIAKLYFKQWTIGFFRGTIENLIRERSFNPDIKWHYLDSFKKFIADPFFVESGDGNIKILLEDLDFQENYGKIYLLSIDKELKQKGYKLLLDTGIHLSYPFVVYEDGKIFIIPEAARSGKLTCYEYDKVSETLGNQHEILPVPLRDATIVRHNGKYWIFGIIARDDTEYKMYVYYSENLFGPYLSHKDNPLKNSLDGTRQAGNFVTVDGAIYRPVQNCHNGYGESMTIYKITSLTEECISEEPYMNISVNRNNRNNRKIHSMHTINQLGDLVVVDGEQWTFAPFKQLEKFIGDLPLFKTNRRMVKTSTN